ncbi:2Fe-2S iron-sulfur cluster binding domain-containing protein [Streptomyces sp. RPA4-5]|uniref:2Fe-2S iron-sulfur cluster-binding protein n=1 Tax=Streptomyces TaxID=1883 RepID=UPI00143E4A34|nr:MULTISPECIES: 2Fe-2S iron-sulfur cluster-binding protein [Streptomyces]MCX4639365.1 2Fe-2S iron-sulfur cluster-binding protein [Streptomyces platensis]QIY56470.1 2Fe-2S iron-sulfur cluster binding domain-containing protein [Streptomyces sp. RPA4-5]WJY39357.1 2Fe-2S iron-sulfur cluster-binding protein [Streptomyces sp. P9-2B-2]
MFHPLQVREIERLTDDAVAVTFAVPPELRTTFRHTPGQHIALRRSVDGQEIRRTYSICTPATDEPVLRVGIRLVEEGAFSTYALKELAVGDTVDVMAPAGRFTLEPRPGHFVGIVGGSGITPVLSIAATLLAQQPDARFCLIRSDRTAASTMFLEEVADLKDRYPQRFQLIHTLSREEQQAGLPSGRLDETRLRSLLPALLKTDSVDGWYLCGPYGLVQGAERALRALDVPRTRIHEEIFHVDNGTPTAPIAATPAHSTVTATLDGRSGNWPVHDGESLLEAVLRNRADAPYACKGGVCGTCRAFLVSGEVRMDRNFALESDEVHAGYVLACQSHPATEKVELDFDR